jgi:MFS transporter, ACS family, glucarate transporter
MKASRTRYSIVALAIGLAILSYVQRVAISQAAGPISHDLHLNKAQMGLIFGAFGLSYALFEVPVGLLGDKVGVRRVLLQIVLGWSTFTALTGAAWNFVSLWVIRFLFGAGEAGCFPILTRMLSMWLPARERVAAQGMLWAFARWGGAFTPPLVLAAIGLIGWRQSFVAFAGLGVIWSIIFWFWFKDNPRQHTSVNDAERELLESSRVLMTHQTGQKNWLSLLLTPEVLFLCLQYFCVSFTWYFYITWLPTYLKEGRGLTASHAAGLSVLPLLFGGFGAMITGALPARLPRRRIAFFALLGTSLLLFVFQRTPDVTLAMVAMGLASLSSDLTMPISWDSCVIIGGPYTATVAATMNMLGNLAGFVMPVVGGMILQRTANNWPALIHLMIISDVIAALCWLYLNPERAGRERERREQGIDATLNVEGASL